MIYSCSNMARSINVEATRGQTWLAAGGKGNTGGVKRWSVRSVQIELIKMDGRLVRHARRLAFQLVQVAISKGVFLQVLKRIDGLHPAPG